MSTLRSLAIVSLQLNIINLAVDIEPKVGSIASRFNNVIAIEPKVTWNFILHSENFWISLFFRIIENNELSLNLSLLHWRASMIMSSCVTSYYWILSDPGVNSSTRVYFKNHKQGCSREYICYCCVVQEFYGILQYNLKSKTELPRKPLKITCQLLRKSV